jgi:hypothetical protein
MKEKTTLIEEFCELYRLCKTLDFKELKVQFPGRVAEFSAMQHTLNQIERVTNERQHTSYADCARASGR